MINYITNHKKILEGLVWIAQNAPGIDQYHIVKVFFFADKEHLNSYGRPIFGDNYVAMDYGPVPSLVLDYINKSGFSLDQAAIAELDKALEVETTSCVHHFKAKRDPELSEFSKTDINILTKALAEHKDKTFGQLVDETHAEEAWKQAWDNRGDKKVSPMDYALFIDESEDREDILEYMRNTAACATA